VRAESQLPNLGQLSGYKDGTVRVSNTDQVNWRVQDWMVGERYSGTDAACLPRTTGGCAVYAFSDLILQSIEPTMVCAPSSSFIVLFGCAGLLLMRRRARKQSCLEKIN